METSSPVVQPSGIGRFRRVAKRLHYVSIAVLCDNIIHSCHRYILLLCLVNRGGERLRQRLAIDLHGISAVAAAADGHVRQGLAGLVPLTRQPRHHAGRRIVLVQRCAQLLSCLRKLLLERVCLEDNGVPLVLEGAEERGDGCEVRWAWGDDLRRLELDQILDREILARDGVGVHFGDVRLDEALLEDIATLARRDGLAGSFS